MATLKPANFSYRFEAFLISAAVLLLEISYTRIVSFKLFYYYTYLVLGLALLGLGAGGVAVAVSKRLKASSTDKILSASLLLSAVAVAGGYLAISPIKLDTLSIWAYNASSISSILWLSLICVLIFCAFVGPGIALATLFGRQPERINSLYFSDLIGAALSCAIVGTLNATWGPPATIMLAAFLFTVAALRAHRRNSPKSLPALGTVAVVALTLTVFAGSLPDQTLDASKGFPAKKSLDTSWSPIFRIDAEQLTPNVRLLRHDGLPGSTVYRWDRTQSMLKNYNFEHDIRHLPFVALQGAPKEEVIIGAAGGHEVLASIYFGAKKIDAVELNPATFNLVKNEYADYDGHLADYPGVNYLNADGRSFISRSNKSYDLIWYPAPDSYAASSAAQAGAFVLSESYLYTYNAVMAVTSHLSEDGIFVAQFGELYKNLPSRTARFTSNVRVALEQMGVTDAGSHIVVVTTPDAFATPEQSTIMVKKSPFTAEQVAAIRDKVTSATFNGRVDWAPGLSVATNPIQQIVSASPADLKTFYANYRFDVKSVSDNNPYFYHFANFGKVLRDYSAPVTTLDREYAVGERVLVLLLLLTVLLAAMFLLVPFFRIREEWRRLPKKCASAVYFAMLGFGFIFFEVTMIQLLNLFLGYPTYSLTVSLMSLLVFAGIGAFLSPRINQVRHATMIGAILLVGLTVFYVWGLRPLTNGLLGWPLPGRIALAFILLAPLGLLLGTFMPRGIAQIAKLGDHNGEYVAWSWAINGFASVTGSVLATICAMQFGFQAVLFIALGFYLVAFASLPRFRSAD